MKKQVKLLFLLFVWLAPCAAFAGGSDATLANGGQVIYLQAVNTTTGSNITTINPGGVACTLIRNGTVTTCGCTPAEVSDASAPGLWKCTLTDAELSVLGNYIYLFTDASDSMQEQRWTVQVKNTAGDALLVAKSGTTLTLASTDPVNQDSQYNNGWRIVFFNAGYPVASSCIVSSTDAGETIVTEDDLSGNPGVGAGIPYSLKPDAACHLTSSKLATGLLTAAKFAANSITNTTIADGLISAAKIVDKALTEQKFGATRTFGAGSSSTSWVLNASETSSDITGQEIVDVASLQSRRCNAYNTSTKTCTVSGTNTVTPTSGNDYVVRGRQGDLGAGVITAATYGAGAIDANAFSQAAADKAWSTATRTVTGGTINTVATGAIAAGSFGAGAIDASALAQAAADKVWLTAARSITAGTVTAVGSGAISSVSFGTDAIGATALSQGAADKAWNTTSRTITGGTVTTAGTVNALGSGAITGASYAADTEGHIGTAQAVTATTIRLASSEDFATNSLANNNSVRIMSATTGVGETACICGNTQSTDLVTLCSRWPTTPTGTVVYSLKSTPNCNTGLWPLAR